jgi:non-canonical purine NTP pyrophosphatase (RdgB/HAM1 family)
MQQCLIASGNAHKVQEIREILKDVPLEILSLKDLPAVPPEPVEDGDSFEANAQIKALGYAKSFDGWVLADDSGIVVPALGGAPGIHSARYAGEHGDAVANRRKLQQAIVDLENPVDAHFVCCLCLHRPGESDQFFESKWEGTLITEDRGEQGFGYDPMFMVKGQDKTAAEMSEDDKNRVSHRALALKSFKDFVEKTL